MTTPECDLSQLSNEQGIANLQHMAPPRDFDPSDRAREKQHSREADARAIASGEKSVEQVRRENGIFVFQRVHVDFTNRKRSR